ncbi:MFS transporter [Candidatus Woesearchaeota archaeon]|nr:MAG: MFS transporter [Candidatus Woesearchaeota archaeon]
MPSRYFKNKNFLSLLLGQMFYHASHSFGWSLFPVYILSLGFSVNDFMWFYALVFLSATLSLLLVREEETRWVLVKGMLIRFAMLVLVFHFFWKWQLWIVAVAYGLFWSLFWIAYNLRYFELSSVSGTAFASALNSAISPLVSVAVPLVTGVLTVSLGYSSSLMVSAFFLFLAVLAFRKVPRRKISYDLSKSLGSVSSIWPAILVEGIWQVSFYVVMPVVTLSYLKSAISYGAFLSYVGLLGVFASFILSRLSDKYKNRSVFLYPLALLMAAFTAISSLSNSVFSWVLLVGLFNLFRAMVSPLMMAVAVDVSKNLEDVMFAREFLFMVGRLIGMSIVLASIYIFNNINLSLFFIGSLAMFYPFLVFRSGIYKELDARMRYRVHNRFRVMIKIWFSAPLMFFPSYIRRRWSSMRIFWKELKIASVLRRK